MHKGKKLLIFMAVTLGVYLSFRYLLPLILPFLAAYWISLLIKPQVKRINKLFRIPASVSAAIVLIVWMIPVTALIFYIGRMFLSQVSKLVETVPVIVDGACTSICSVCCRIDSVCGIESGTVYGWLADRYEIMMSKASAFSMDYVVGNGIPILSCIFNAMAVIIIIFIAIILSPGAWERVRRWRTTSAYRQEIDRIANKLKIVAVSFVGTQLVILILTSLICTIGLTVLGSSYAVLFGICIGFVDLLPVLGTGTVFIPWIIYLCVSGDYRSAAIIMTTYITCYFLREILEAKLMGNGIGMGSLETLIAIYIGFKLFGLAGAITGPVGFIIIKEFMDLYCGEKESTAGS